MKEVTLLSRASNARKVRTQTSTWIPRNILRAALLLCVAFIGSSILVMAQAGQLSPSVRIKTPTCSFCAGQPGPASATLYPPDHNAVEWSARG